MVAIIIQHRQKNSMVKNRERLLGRLVFQVRKKKKFGWVNETNLEDKLNIWKTTSSQDCVCILFLGQSPQ